MQSCTAWANERRTAKLLLSYNDVSPSRPHRFSPTSYITPPWLPRSAPSGPAFTMGPRLAEPAPPDGLPGPGPGEYHSPSAASGPAYTMGAKPKARCVSPTPPLCCSVSNVRVH